MAKKSKVNIPAIHIIRLIVFLFIGLMVSMSYSRAYDFLTTSDLFVVRDVVIDRSIQFIDTEELRRLKGGNIFRVDISRLHAKIKTKYPQISELRVMRELPDRIKVLAKKREPLYQVSHRGTMLVVDQDGVAMYHALQPENLPYVEGVIHPQARINLGTALASKNLALVAAVLAEFKKYPHTARLKMKGLHLSNPSRIDADFGDFHVFLDSENFSAKLGLLEMMLSQQKISLPQTKYVDLRFNEPVLGENADPADP